MTYPRTRGQKDLDANSIYATLIQRARLHDRRRGVLPHS